MNSKVVKILGSLPSKQISVALVTAERDVQVLITWKRVQDNIPVRVFIINRISRFISEKGVFMNISVVYFVHPMTVAKYLVDVTILDCNASLELVYDVLKSSDTYTVDGDLFRYEQIDFFNILSDLY